MGKTNNKIIQFIVSIFKYHFQVFPNIMSSGVRWGLLQSYLTLALFFVALYFPLQPKVGEPMTIVNYIAYGCLGIGILLLLYSAFLVIRFTLAGSLGGTEKDNATKEDLTSAKTQITNDIQELTRSVNRLTAEIRADRNARRRTRK